MAFDGEVRRQGTARPDVGGEVRRQGTARPGVGAAAEDTADLELMNSMGVENRCCFGGIDGNWVC